MSFSLSSIDSVKYKTPPHSPPAPIKKVSLFRCVVWTTSRLVITTINQILVWPAWLALIFAAQPVRIINYKHYLYLEGLLYRHLLELVPYWGWFEGHRIYESGADIASLASKRCLVLPNHQSTADIPMLFAAFHNKKDVTEHIMWVSDLELMFSHIGLVCLFHGDMFIRQRLGSAQREKTLLQVEKHLKNKFVAKKRRWCVVFPEGGFFRKRKLIGQRYSLKKGHPVFERLSGPRVFGVDKILRSVESADPDNPFEYIVDIIIAYQDQSRCLGLPDWIISGKHAETIHMHYSIYPVSDLDMESLDTLEKSLFKIWDRKEKMINNFYDYGYFESSDEKQSLCEFSDFRCISMNVLYSCFTLCFIWPGCKFFMKLFFALS